MVAFTSSVDIGNRALQHCGATRVASFTEDSRNASEVSFAYDKLREAELRERYWTFAIKHTILRAIDSNTMRLAAALWASTTTYFTGSIVTDQSGNLWISRITNNLNNDPLLTSYWEPYFGPRTVSLYDATTTYFAGELAYTTSGDGKSRIYLSLQSDNADTPGTATAYDATVTYFKNQVVTYLAVAYMSLIDLNKNNTPSAAPALFNIATVYAIGNQVGASDGVIYTSLSNGNVGNDPTLDAGVHWTNTGTLNPWTTVFTGGTGSDKWLEIGGTEFPMGVGITTMNILYPIGTGPSTQDTTRNVYLKPAGYLRLAPQNPKPGMGALGGPTGVLYNDWLLEGEYLITGDLGPIPLRFVADFTDVARMDPNFCEGLAARIAMSICDTITQSNSQVQLVAKIFSEWQSRAKMIDGVEQGFDDPPDDEYIAVRL